MKANKLIYYSETGWIPRHFTVATSLATVLLLVPLPISAQEPKESGSSDVSLTAPKEKPGVIRVKLHPFTYTADPNGIAIFSYQSLGNLSLYKVRVFPEPFLKAEFDAIKSTENLVKLGFARPIVGRDAEARKVAMSKITRATLLTDGENKQTVLNYLKESHPLFASIDASLTHVDIPAPAGTYYFDYSLYFPLARNDRFRNLHMNYPNPRADKWGPAKVKVISGNIAEIELKPTRDANGYKYDDEDFANGSQAYREFVDYLLKTGQD